MFTFIVGAAVLLIGLFVGLASSGATRLLAFVAALVVGGFMVGSSCFTVIQAKNVGVLTSFGKPVASLDAGFHWKAPWQKVTELDGTKITNKYEGEGAIEVRIGDGTTAQVETAIRWSIVGDKADQIYADYRSDDVNETVRESLVETVYKNAINQVLGSYNPTEGIQAVDPTKASMVNFTPDLDALSKQVTDSMRARVAESGGYVGVEFATISQVKLSETTQKKINEFQAEIARTQVALQAEQTNAAQARANKALSASISKDPNILVSRCFDTFDKMVEAAQPVPAGGINCWPGEKADLILTGR
ncbi:SPFH domain-containing protein [Nocardioides yefusunii]|uniref:SPFH domain-containing protein n=1 Tax=Nocardioides yefusunii TaxID=2500546 RepID=A0ABW1QX07_9ACTN|nr:SPFH domain-containing protein [Nocardioides yefusunii]